jgi:transposase
MAWFTTYRRLARDFRVAAAIHSEGLSIKEAAQRFSVTPRTIFRILNRCRHAMQELTPEEAEVFASLVV